MNSQPSRLTQSIRFSRDLVIRLEWLAAMWQVVAHFEVIHGGVRHDLVADAV
jgi:hypothetical protein